MVDHSDAVVARPSRRARMLGHLGELMRSGRLTEKEARRLTESAGDGEVEDTIRDVRIRHASARLAAAVTAGSITRDDADVLLDRVRGGDHSRELRTYINALRPRP